MDHGPLGGFTLCGVKHSPSGLGGIEYLPGEVSTLLSFFFPIGVLPGNGVAHGKGSLGHVMLALWTLPNQGRGDANQGGRTIKTLMHILSASMRLQQRQSELQIRSVSGDLGRHIHF